MACTIILVHDPLPALETKRSPSPWQLIEGGREIAFSFCCLLSFVRQINYKATNKGEQQTRIRTH